MPQELALLSDEAYQFEILSLVCSLAGTASGVHFLSKSFRLKPILLSLVYANSDRCQRVALFTIRRIVRSMTLETTQSAMRLFRQELQDEDVHSEGDLFEYLLACAAKAFEIEIKDYRAASRGTRYAHTKPFFFLSWSWCNTYSLASHRAADPGKWSPILQDVKISKDVCAEVIGFLSLFPHSGVVLLD